MSADARLERMLVLVLGVGVRTSAVCLLVGLVWSLAQPGSRPAGWAIHAGLVILMATPVARVFVSVAGYLRERDWLFVALTSIVLTLLLGSLVAALA
jgi:uncharacterized membrane protein